MACMLGWKPISSSIGRTVVYLYPALRREA